MSLLCWQVKLLKFSMLMIRIIKIGILL
ncbi:hypothetical protein LINGRAHAP2_LOCUS4756 [Linum grandiflorum]